MLRNANNNSDTSRPLHPTGRTADFSNIILAVTASADFFGCSSFAAIRYTSYYHHQLLPIQWITNSLASNFIRNTRNSLSSFHQNCWSSSYISRLHLYYFSSNRISRFHQYYFSSNSKSRFHHYYFSSNISRFNRFELIGFYPYYKLQASSTFTNTTTHWFLSL